MATDDNMAHAHCMRGTKGYKHILGICNTYCFSTATIVARIPCYVLMIMFSEKETASPQF